MEMDYGTIPRQQRRVLWLERRNKRWKDCTKAYYQELDREEEAGNTTEEPDYSEDDEQDIGDQETDRGLTPLGSRKTIPKKIAPSLDEEDIIFANLSSSLFIAIAIDADLFDPFLQILSF
jgi:hypothetical protein